MFHYSDKVDFDSPYLKNTFNNLRIIPVQKRNFILTNTETPNFAKLSLLISQVGPAQPGGQLQRKSLASLWQVPLFLQGDDPQKLIAVSQLTPVNPAWHSHLYWLASVL